MAMPATELPFEHRDNSMMAREHDPIGQLPHNADVPNSLQRSTAISLANLDDAFINHLSQEELRAKLKEAMNVLRDRERDLAIAAEVGQHLLEAHTAMRDAYEHFVDSQPTSSVPNLTRATSSPSELSRDPSLEMLSTEDRAKRHQQKIQCFVESCENLFASSNGIRSAHDNNMRKRGAAWASSMEYLSKTSFTKSVEYLAGLKSQLAPLFSRNARNSWTNLYQIKETQVSDLDPDTTDYIADVETTKSTYMAQIEALTAQLNESAQARAKEAERYTQQLEQVRNDLAKVTEQAELLERDKRRLMRQMRENTKEKVSQELEDQELIDRLRESIHEAQSRNEKLLADKEAVERQLEQVMDEMHQMESELAALDDVTPDDAGLRQVCEKQGALIRELQDQLEELRAAHALSLAELADQSTREKNDIAARMASCRDSLYDVLTDQHVRHNSLLQAVDAHTPNASITKFAAFDANAWDITSESPESCTSYADRIYNNCSHYDGSGRKYLARSDRARRGLVGSSADNLKFLLRLVLLMLRGATLSDEQSVWDASFGSATVFGCI